jgi:tetratricopeptide (TPR) repeat protein
VAVSPLLGRAYLDQGRHAELLERLPAQLPPGPALAEVLVQRGRAHLALGQVNGADLDFQMAARQAPEAAEPVFGQAQVALARGDTKRAETLVDLATERDPRLSDAWQVAGELKILRRDFTGALAGGRREEATADLQSLLESGAASGQAGYLLGLVRL